MKSGRNPTRRSRNIGTAKQGRGQDNKLVIPWNWQDSREFYEKLLDPRTVSREISGQPFTFLVESTRRESVHPCTVDDITCLLGHVPATDLEGLNVVVLRQPKRKEQILSSIWGRLIHAADFCHISGPAIILDAPDLSKPLRWSKSLTPESARELERLGEDGHRVVSNRREWVIEATLESTRATMLYRTLLHEIGHWVDWLDCVLRPTAARRLSEAAIDDLEARYFARPGSERESAAHRYGDALVAQLRETGIIPFERMLDPNSLKSDKLRLEDFEIPERRQ